MNIFKSKPFITFVSGFVAIGTAIGIYIVVKGGGTTISCAAPAVICLDPINGNDSTGLRGNLSKPFKTFNGSYAAAQCGDTVQVTSNPTDISIDAITSGCKATITPIAQHAVCVSTCVKFTPAPGATVTLSPTGGLFSIRASHVELDSFNDSGSIHIWPEGDLFATAQTPDDVELNNVNGASAMNVACATNILIQNGNIGPGNSVDSLLDVQSASSGCKHQSQWGLVFNEVIHDAFTTTPLNHVDCMHWFDFQNWTLDRSLIYGCEHIGLFADSAYLGNLSCCTGLVLQNNVFGASKSGASTIELGGSAEATTFANTKFINNTFIGAVSFDTGTPGDQWPSTFLVANNIIPQSFNTCTQGSITFSDNAMPLNNGSLGPQEPGTNCAGSGNFRLSADTVCITSDGNPLATPYAVAPDPHLITGTNPCNNTGNPIDAPSYDFYGVTRANPPDVGAVEG